MSLTKNKVTSCIGSVLGGGMLSIYNYMFRCHLSKETKEETMRISWEKHVMGREESKHKDQKAGAWPGTGNGGRSVEQRGKE